MTRTATCSCQAVRIEVTGKPLGVVACHCIACQRRSGTPFGVGAYFKRDQARITGTTTTYVRKGDSGHDFRTYFCPVCGTTVYWDTAFKPDEIGVAVGAFADPYFPAPVRSVWEESRHSWVDTLSLKIPRYLTSRNAGPITD